MKIKLQFPWKVDKDGDGVADDEFGDLWVEWLLLWLAAAVTLLLVLGVLNVFFGVN